MKLVSEELRDICAYKSFVFYGDKCDNCLGTPDIEICYITTQELKEHLERWDCLRLEDKVL